MDLSIFPFCDTLEDEAVSFLKERSRFVKLPKKQILFMQGDFCDSVLFLIKGKVKLYLQTLDAEEITLYVLTPGEQCIVNTASLLSSSEATGTAVALEDIEGYMLAKNDVKKLIQMSPYYLEYIFSLYTLRMQDLAYLIEDIKFKRLDERLMQYLLKQATNLIFITHEELSSHLGSPRAVISRTLKELEKQKKLVLYRGSIKLLLD
jgi:CRP/FNR family transcriptional regulator, anaerobic regulatory protein